MTYEFNNTNVDKQEQMMKQLNIYLAHFFIKYLCGQISFKPMKLYLITCMSNLTCKIHKFDTESNIQK